MQHVQILLFKVKLAQQVNKLLCVCVCVCVCVCGDEYEYGYVFLAGVSMPLLSRTVTSRDDIIMSIPLFPDTQMLQTSTRSDVLKTSGRELKQLFGLGT